jgi:hypothetical protein
MVRFRQGSVSKRAAISMIALYALLMQGFLASTAQTKAFGSQGDITCAPGKTGPAAPAGGERHSHGACCILACAAASAAYLENSSFGISVAPARTASVIVWADSSGAETLQVERFHFAPRGPPVRA